MYRWVDHTAEVELAIEAPELEQVLSEALTALAELVEPDAADMAVIAAGAERRAVDVRARDLAGLLAAWLEELVFLAEAEGFVGASLVRYSLVRCAPDAARLDTVVAGRLGVPRPVVKAVTYHRLAFEATETGYVANVVFDV